MVLLLNLSSSTLQFLCYQDIFIFLCIFIQHKYFHRDHCLHVRSFATGCFLWYSNSDDFAIIQWRIITNRFPSRPKMIKFLKNTFQFHRTYLLREIAIDDMIDTIEYVSYIGALQYYVLYLPDACLSIDRGCWYIYIRIYILKISGSLNCFIPCSW